MGDGHVLAVTVALLLATLTGRSDLVHCWSLWCWQNQVSGNPANRSQL